MPTELTLTVATLDDLTPAITSHFERPAVFARGDEVPLSPGAYVWTTPDGAVAYIGSAASLQHRLRNELKWTSEHDVEKDWQVTVVHLLKKLGATPQWVTTETSDEAKLLERRLIEYHRAVSGTAPLLVGWNAAAGSATADARDWSQRLYNSLR